MSVPETPKSKAAPSLLSGEQKDERANGSRILASLEGRVESRAEKPRRFKPAFALLGLLIGCAVAFGGWHYLRDARTDSPIDAAADGNANKTITGGISAAPASAAVALKPASGTNALAGVEASAPQAATIVAAEDNVASAPDTTGRIASALERGASDEIAASAPIAHPATPKTALAHNETKSARKMTKRDVREYREARDSKSSRHATLAADDRKHHPEPVSKKPEDQDVDLLAALVSRTKPYTPPAGAKSDAVATKSSAKSNAAIAARLKECGTQGFFKDQICRWRVCDGHWGTDPACPATAAANNSHN
jgi:hypothetical protein